MELEITTKVLLWSFGIAVVMGAVVYKTNFCTMGAVSDLVNIGDKGRLRAWFLAVAVAMTGVLFIEWFVHPIESSLPPYRTPGFAWLRYIVGGLLFGIGMTLASGCGERTIVRIGGGNLKSLVVFVILGIFAYLMTKTVFYEKLFHPWVSATTVNLVNFGLPTQDIGGIAATLVGSDNVVAFRLMLGGVLAALLLFLIFKAKEFRASFDNILAGVVVGLSVAAAWYITAGPMGREWIEYVDWLDERPLGVAAQSYTFVNPIAESLVYVLNPTNTPLISFGVAAVGGVLVGSFLYAVVSGSFKLEWFASLNDFVRHVIGGVLAMGCTIGQAVTGTSTLARGSMLAFASIILGAALTMKVQYYKMLYESKATFAQALIAGLADLHLLPDSLRKLEAV